MAARGRHLFNRRLVANGEQARRDLSLEAFCEFRRELENHGKRSEIDLNVLDETGSVARQYRAAADRFAERLSLPLKVSLRPIDGFVRESQGIVHASRRRGQKRRNVFDTGAGSAENGGDEHGAFGEGSDEFRRSTFSDKGHPVLPRLVPWGTHPGRPSFAGRRFVLHFNSQVEPTAETCNAYLA